MKINENFSLSKYLRQNPFAYIVNVAISRKTTVAFLLVSKRSMIWDLTKDSLSDYILYSKSTALELFPSNFVFLKIQLSRDKDSSLSLFQAGGRQTWPDEATA